MDPTKMEAAITPRTKAIMPVHLYGQPAEMDPILAIADKHGLAVIEDACQAHGAEYKGRRCGSMGRLGCFSFYPGKNLGAYGEGGAVVTSDPALAARVRSLRSWGEETRYEHKYKGYNYRMDGIQGAILAVKLKYLDSWTEARRSHAAEYARCLAETTAITPTERADVRHVYHVYVVRVAERDAWRAKLSDAGVQTGVHYPIPVHLQPGYRDLGYSEGDFPVAERAASEVLSLPIYPELTPEQIHAIARVFQTVEARG
jgi:dTDP-4-amino-4,6-dideoxygalactose transaminase